jgi:anti-sigma factor RsiW
MDRDGHVRMLLGALILGGLPAAEASAVRAHLEICGRCRAEHDELARVPGWLDLVAEAGNEGDQLAARSGRRPTRRARAAKSLRLRRRGIRGCS